MASVKWLQWIFLEFFSFTMCLAKYFTLVLPHADKSSTVIPIGVLTSQTKLHCATLCDLVPSCYSFTYSIDSLADNCRLLPSTAKSSTFTVSAAGNKHYERKVDCKCIVIHLSLIFISTFVIIRNIKKTQCSFVFVRLKFNN